MEKITLQPGVWTRVSGQFFQPKSGNTALRVHYGAAAPATNTDVFFIRPDYEAKPFEIPYLQASRLYLMPDEDQPVEVVVW